MYNHKNYFTINLVKKHNNFRRSTINLLPSENILSPNVLKILSSDLAGRYSLKVNDYIHGYFVKNAYGGEEYFEEILEFGTNLAKKIFDVKNAEIRPLSGHISAMISMISVMNKKDSYLAISPENGGYDGYSNGYLPDLLNLNYYEIPFNSHRWDIDYENLEREAKRIKPKSIILGASYILFSYDLKYIRDIADINNSYILYDASHVMGLIGANKFQSDLMKYVDLLYGSTHKSLFGPQGGIILTNNDELYENIEKNIVWKTMDNYHLNRVAALVQALEEFHIFRYEYAENILKNSLTLGKYLDEYNLVKKFEGKITESHQIFLKDPSNCERFIRSYIITDCVGRLGTNEITRLGMVENDVIKLGELMLESLNKNIKDKVINFRKSFKIKYY
ncbi:MAG: serine hydroxymethyltransferase [Thermoplasmata archaeon]